MKIKTILKVIGILLACYLVYMFTAMLMPFVNLKSVSDTHQTFNRDNYYGSQISVDRAAIVEDSDAALEERVRMIAGAKKQIILSTFDMRSGESVKDLISALMDAADRGVKVKVLVDGISGIIHMRSSLFYVLSSYPGVEVRMYNTPNFLMPWTFNGRMHDKYLISDHTVMILGGRNTYDYFLGNYIDEGKSYDRDVLVYNGANSDKGNHSSVIYETEKYFESVWNSKDCRVWNQGEKVRNRSSVIEKVAELKSHFAKMKEEHDSWFEGYKTYKNRTEETKKCTLITGETSIYGKEPLVWYQLQKLMEQAKDSVRIHSPYAVMGKDMYDGLRRVAQSVPNSSLMINAAETGDNFVASSDYMWNKERVADTSVNLMEFVGDMSYHGKSMVIDHELAIVGSFNLDLRSAYVDTEVMLAVDSEKVAAQLEEQMDRYEKQAKPLLFEDGKLIYEKEDPLIIEEMPWYKETAMKVTGFFMQAVRYLI